MNDKIRVFVNEHAVEIDAGASAETAVGEFDRELRSALDGGSAYLTDGVGRRLDPDSIVDEGAIVRVIKIARKAGQ